MGGWGIWRDIMILVVVATWNTTRLLLGVVDLGGMLLPLPSNVVPPDVRSRVNGGTDNPRCTTAEAHRRCCRVWHATTTMTRTTMRQQTTTIGSSALALMAILRCIAPLCRDVRCRLLRRAPLVVVLHHRCRRTAPPMFRGVKLSNLLTDMKKVKKSASTYCLDQFDSMYGDRDKGLFVCFQVAIDSTVKVNLDVVVEPSAMRHLQQLGDQAHSPFLGAEL